jgi:hypothetical protein
LRREGYSGHKAPSELLAKLRRAPQGRAGETELRARPVVVLALVAAKPLVIQIRQLQRQIGEAMHAHPDGEIFLSLFRAPGSVICAATLLAEIGDCRARYAPAIASECGAVPLVSSEVGEWRVGRGGFVPWSPARSPIARSPRQLLDWTSASTELPPPANCLAEVSVASTEATVSTGDPTMGGAWLEQATSCL